VFLDNLGHNILALLMAKDIKSLRYTPINLNLVGSKQNIMNTVKDREESYISTKQIPINERLIFALDLPDQEKAKEYVVSLGDSVQFYKLGLELFMAGGYFELVKWLTDQNKKVLVDLKFFDVPQTVGSAVRQLKKYGASFATVHGNDKILEAAVKEKNGIKILAVTVLTSLDQRDIEDLGFNVDIEELVLSRARRALKLGCDGVISSGLEAPQLRAGLGNKFLIVTPGIRPVENVDDQKRTVNVEEAFKNGADYIVVGRPIRDAEDPRKAAESIQEKIATLFPAN
jgi:orotidine-5'-phosphate decarboxylase